MANSSRHDEQIPLGGVAQAGLVEVQPGDGATGIAANRAQLDPGEVARFQSLSPVSCHAADDHGRSTGRVGWSMVSRKWSTRWVSSWQWG